MDPALGQEAQQAVRRLAMAVSLAEGFALHLLVVDTQRLARVVVDGIAPKALWVRPRARLKCLPGDEPKLVQELVSKLEAALKPSKRQRVLAIDATGDEPWHERAWAAVFRRLNERRNELIRARGAPMLLTLHPSLEACFASNAPDLWSVRGPRLLLGDILGSGTQPLPEQPRPGDLLRAATRALPFVGRDEQLRELLSWRDSEVPISVRMIVGDGGTGKTRLAVELCGPRHRQEWLCGFLQPKADNDAVARLASDNGDRLVVVDEAARRSPQILHLLGAAAEAGTSDRLRVLMLSRTMGDWYDELSRSVALADPQLEPIAVSDLTFIPIAKKDQQKLFHRARDAFRAWAGREQEQRVRKPILSGEEGTPLFVLLAALAALEGKRLSDAEALLNVALDRELAMLERWLGGPSNGVARLLAALTLAGGWDREGASSLAQAIGEEALNPGVLDCLVHCYSEERGGGTWIPGLEPDMLGETLVVRVLRHEDRPSDLLVAALDAGAPTLTLLTVCSRVAQRWDGGRRWLDDLLERRLNELALPALEVAIRSDGPTASLLVRHLETAEPELCLQVMEACPERTVSLMEVARVATKRCLDAWSLRDETKDEQWQAEFSRLYNSLGFRLSALGRHKQALEATTEAVDIYRKLAKDKPELFLPDLAAALGNLGVDLRCLGRHEEALEITRESVKLIRKLAVARFDEFPPFLAKALGNLGLSLASIGEPEQALEATTEAVDIYRKLAKSKPDEYLPELAAALNNQGIRFSELGRGDDALEATSEAVVVYRKLAEHNTDAFLPGLSSTLNYLSVVLSRLGRREQALTAATEAVDIRRILATERPGSFSSSLASALTNLGIMFSKLSRQEEALKATTEAVTIWWTLSKERPDAILPELAAALTNQGNDLSSLGKREEALEASKEAVGIYRELVKRIPNAFLTNLARALTNLGIRISELGRHEEALEATTEAVDILRVLSKDRPEPFRHDLGLSLVNQGMNQTILGMGEEALEATTEAVAIFRKLAEDESDAFLPDLARSLRVLDRLLRKLGRQREARRCLEEAIQALTPHFSRYPQALHGMMSSMVSDYRARCETTGVQPEADILAPIEALLDGSE